MNGNGSAAGKAGVVYVGAPWEGESCVFKFCPGRHSHTKPPKATLNVGRHGEGTVPAGAGALSSVVMMKGPHVRLRCLQSSRTSSIKNCSVK